MNKLLNNVAELNLDDDDLYGNNDIDQDDDAPTDGFLPFFNYGMPLDDYNIIFKQKHPTNSQWRDKESPNARNVTAEINGARQSLWDQAKVEIEFVKTKVEAALGKRPPSIENLVCLFFGPESRIGCLITERLGMKNDEFIRIIGTYSLAAAYNLSKTQLFSKTSFVKNEGLADEKTYQSFWNSVSKFGCTEGYNNAMARGAKPLWIDVQNAVNDNCRDFFVVGFDKLM
jgi:hypothetical protein